MYQKEDVNQRLSNVRKKLWKNLVINWLVPLVLVILIRSIYQNDVIALAIAGAIPLVRTAIVFVWRHRVDWIGVLGALGFIIAFIISVFSGGSSLPLKLYHPIATGILGLALLVSVIIRKPLLIIILRTLKHGDPERFNNKENYRKFNILTAFLGLIFTVDAAIHIFMAFTMQTVSFMALSKVITWAMILIIIIGGRWIVGKNNKDR